MECIIIVDHRRPPPPPFFFFSSRPPLPGASNFFFFFQDVSVCSLASRRHSAPERPVEALSASEPCIVSHRRRQALNLADVVCFNRPRAAARIRVWYAPNPRLRGTVLASPQAVDALTRRLKHVCRAAGVVARYDRRRPMAVTTTRENATVNAVSLAVPAVRAACPRGPYYTRTMTWCKLALLAEATRSFSATWYAFVDADVVLAPRPAFPLHVQPDVARWLRDPNSSLFVAREMPSAPGGKCYEFYRAPHSRNRCTNSQFSSHLVVVKPNSSAVLSAWFCRSEALCDVLRGGIGCYRTDWPHEQYVLDTLPSMGVRLHSPQRAYDYNGANGRFVRHLYLKDASSHRVLTADVRAFF